MNQVSHPAVLVLARIDRKAGQVIAFKDNRILENDQDFDARRREFRALEDLGGANYLYRLAELAKADQVVEEQRAELEYEAGWRDTPDLEPETAPSVNGDHLDQAYNLARAAFSGDKATLARLERALELVNVGAVVDLGGGQYQVSSQNGGGAYHVNGRCGCGDYTQNGRGWCKHRLAVALVKRAEQLKEGAGSAENTPAPESAPEGDNTQQQDTTTFDLAQIRRFCPTWDARGVDLVTLDGQHQKRLDLDHTQLEARARAAGWRESRRGSGGWMNPAIDWEAETRRNQAAWEEQQAKRDRALPVEHTRGRAKLFKS